MAKVTPSKSLSTIPYQNGFSPRASSRALTPLAIKDPEFHAKKRWLQTAKVTVLLVSPMILLLVMTIMAHVDALQTQRNSEMVIYSIKTSLEVAELVRMLQIERGRTSMYLSSNRTNQAVRKQLAENRADTDSKFKLVTDWSFVDIYHLNKSALETRGPDFFNMMRNFRRDADQGYISITGSLKFFSKLNHELIGTLFSGSEAPNQYKHLVAFDSFARAGESAGIQRAIGAAFWIPCDYLESNKLWLIETHSDHSSMLEASFRYFPPLKESYTRIIGSYAPLWEDIERMVCFFCQFLLSHLPPDIWLKFVRDLIFSNAMNTKFKFYTS